MTKESYLRITSATRRALARIPGGERITRVPTLVCAAAYCAMLVHLMLFRDVRVFRAILVPAACFLVCTALRPVIGRQRPYDRFGAPPVGSFVPGKGKSMPSRHTASAAAIAFAVAVVFPAPGVMIACALLTLLIAFLRVALGQHYVSDVLAAIALSLVISLIGYTI